MFHCEKLTKKIGGGTVLAELSYRFPASGVIGIVGPNGVGKTTLLNLLSGIEVPTSGICTFEGKCTSRLGVLGLSQRGVSRLFQNPIVVGSLSVTENIITASEEGIAVCFGNSSATIHKRVISASRYFGLDALGSSKARDISFGEKRRLSLACCMARINTRCMILDEPFAGLDKRWSNVLVNWIIERRNEGSVLTILVDHHIDIVRDISDGVIELGSV